MHHFLRRYPLALMIVWLLPFVAVAQSDSSGPLYIGLYGGYETGNVQINWENAPNYGFFYNGTITTQTGGAEISRPFMFGERLGLSARIGVALSDAAFVQQLPDVLVLLPGNPNPVAQTIEQRLSFSMQELQFELLGSYKLGWLSFRLGPYFGIRRLLNVRNTQNLIEPANARFVNPDQYPTENDGRTLVFDDGSSLSRQAVTFGGMLMLAIPVELTDEFTITPETFLRADFLSPVSGGQWFGFAGGVGLSLSYQFDRGPEISVMPPPLPTASVDLYSTDGNGNRLEQLNVTATVEKHFRQVDLLPMIYFDAGSAILPERYPQLARSTVDTLASDSIAALSDIARQDARTTYYNLLNIVGARLHRDRKARVRLVGITSSDIPPAFARARAEAVQHYLRDVWNVDAEQLKTDVAAMWSDNEAGGVRIETLSGEPVTRLYGEWHEYAFDTTPIRVKPSIKAPTGVRRWELTFLRDNSVIARQSSDENNSGALSTSLLLRDIQTGITPPLLTAELVVEDSSGGIATARDQLGVSMPDLTDTSHASSRWHYQVFGNVSRELIEEIVASTPRGARIVVSAMDAGNGGTYKVADDAVSGAAGRLQAAFNAAGRNDIQVAERTSRDMIHPARDMLPEQRAMMSGIVVTVEQNIDNGLATKP